jgi:histidine triad (HIT) family protein
VNDPTCVFCEIAAGKVAADIVFRDAHAIAFLDNRPLFPGHVLLCPIEHYQTLADLPDSLLGPLSRLMKLLSITVERALHADGSFVAINNRISQSVPHLHIHVTPRRKKDGLRGFFWPRQKYGDPGEKEAIRLALAIELQKLLA